MIPLTRLNGEQVAINPDRIERAEVTPDVILTMTDGTKYVIAESLQELVDRVRYFRASVLALSQQLLVVDDETPVGLRLVRNAEGEGEVERHAPKATGGAQGDTHLHGTDGTPAGPEGSDGPGAQLARETPTTPLHPVDR